MSFLNAGRRGIEGDFATFIFLLLLLCLATSAHAQYKKKDDNPLGKAGFAKAFWLSAGYQSTTFGTVPESAPDDFKAYGDALPSRLDVYTNDDSANDGVFLTIGFKFLESQSVSYVTGWSRGFKVDKRIDTNKDGTYDTYVDSGQFSYNLIAYYYFPHPYAFIGTGLFDGTLNFKVDPDLTDSDPTLVDKKFPYNEEVAFTGFAIPLFGNFLINGTISFRSPREHESFVENNWMIGFGYFFPNTPEANLRF